MKDLLLLKRLIKTLYERFNLKGIPQTREEFVAYFAENERKSLCCYRSDRKDEYRVRIDSVLGTQIPPRQWQGTPREELQKYYIGYDGSSENLLVTAKGIEFKSISGFIQTAGGKFNKMWYGVGMVVSFIIGKYWDSVAFFIKEIFT